MASSTEREATRANQQDHTERASAAGHELVWQLGENATRRGHAYFLVAECGHCGAVVTVGATWSSSYGSRDARAVPCSGPGTAVLTEIENARLSELVIAALADFAAEIPSDAS